MRSLRDSQVHEGVQGCGKEDLRLDGQRAQEDDGGKPDYTTPARLCTDYFAQCIRWGVDAVITDYTQVYLDLRRSVEADYAKADAENGRLFMWTSFHYYLPWQLFEWYVTASAVERIGGPFELKHELPRPALKY